MKTVHCTCDQNCKSVLKPAQPGQSAADLRPHLKAEWHPTLNGCHTLDLFTVGSGYRATWACSNPEHKPWTTSISNRARLGSGCPECGIIKRAAAQAGMIRPPLKGHSLAERFPVLAAAWDYEANGDVIPDMVGPASEYIAAWKCSEGHKRKQVVASAVGTHKKSGNIPCRSCTPAKRRIPKPGRSFGDVYPEIAKYFHPTKNGDKTPYDYNPRANEYVWWLCDKGHETYALINSKAVGHDCSDCNTRNRSKVESVFKETFRIQPSVQHVEENTQRVPVAWRTRSVMSVDILFTTTAGQNVAVEYDGSYHHDSTRFPDIQARDLAKTHALLEAGYIVVRIRENRLEHLKIEHPNLLQVSHCYKAEIIRKPENVQRTITQIMNWLG